MLPQSGTEQQHEPTERGNIRRLLPYRRDVSSSFSK